MTDLPADPIKPGRLHAAARYGWLALGFVFVALGVIGALLPLMPTTIFLILAAGCFARSSPRLEAWLLDHPRFGPTLRAWRRDRAIPRRAKLMACTGITIGYVIFLATARPHLPLALLVAAAMGGCALFILSRPTATAWPDA
ncbi:YbaN family protein [Sphingomonas sp. LR60]|uniref:YbaN family protein n=1 Tax=Sphingomonas sp. LR60 TaxID=3050233 RepID=UPI002FDFB4A2